MDASAIRRHLEHALAGACDLDAGSALELLVPAAGLLELLRIKAIATLNTTRSTRAPAAEAGLTIDELAHRLGRSRRWIVKQRFPFVTRVSRKSYAVDPKAYEAWLSTRGEAPALPKVKKTGCKSRQQDSRNSNR